MSKQSKAQNPRETRDEARRGWFDVLRMWAACENPACHRAHACRGEIRQCTGKNFWRLPRRVQAFYAGLVLSGDHGLSFDDAVACFEDERTPAAYVEWVQKADAMR